MVYRLCLAFILIACSGCVTTKCAFTCNKTIHLDNRPINDTMNVGVRLELFRDWSRK